jgi:ribulose-phosphate 3-epimerase
MPEVLDKVRILRGELGFDGEIEMDGGIGPDTIAACAAAGTNVFVAGTSVFGAADVAGRIGELRSRAAAAQC